MLTCPLLLPQVALVGEAVRESPQSGSSQSISPSPSLSMPSVQFSEQKLTVTVTCAVEVQPGAEVTVTV